MKENIAALKSADFAIKIIQLYKILVEEMREYVMSKQLLRSGTAIGALIREAEHAESNCQNNEKKFAEMKNNFTFSILARKATRSEM